MKNELGFEILENANDKNIERLSEHKVLTQEEKKRILKMSIDKMNKRINDTDDGEHVSGVEPYKRPKWYGFAAAAACLVLVGGIIGTAMLLSRNGQTPDIDPLATATTTATTGTDTNTTAAVTTTAFETTTGPADSGVDNFDSLAKTMLIQLERFDRITSGTGIDVDNTVQETIQHDGVTVQYNPVTDFKSLSEIKAYFSESFTQDFLSENSYLWEGETPLFKEINGRLCFIQIGRGGRFDFKGKFELFDITDDSFQIVSESEAAGGFRETITVNCKKENGTWKIDSYTSDASQAEVSDGIDYNAFHLDEYGALVFDKPVEEQNDATLIAAAQALHNSACGVQFSISSGSYPFNFKMDTNSELPESVDPNYSGTPYYLITQDGFNSKDDIIEKYYKTFSSKYPYHDLLDQLFIDYDGRVYGWGNGAGRGSDISYANSEIASYDDRDGNEMHFTVNDNYDDTLFGGTTYTQNHEFTMVQDNDGVWRVGKFTLPY